MEWAKEFFRSRGFPGVIGFALVAALLLVAKSIWTEEVLGCMIENAAGGFIKSISSPEGASVVIPLGFSLIAAYVLYIQGRRDGIASLYEGPIDRTRTVRLRDASERLRASTFNGQTQIANALQDFTEAASDFQKHKTLGPLVIAIEKAVAGIMIDNTRDGVPSAPHMRSVAELASKIDDETRWAISDNPRINAR